MRRGTLAAGALVVAFSGIRCRGQAELSSKLRKSISLGPAGCIEPGSPQDLRYGKNRAWIRDSRTQWVHMWADWPTLQPAADAFDENKLSELDAQVDLARSDGAKVMLTLYRFPGWANGTGAMTAEQLEATMPDRRGSDVPGTEAKPLHHRYPDDLSEESPWGRFVEMILRRYAGRAAIVQICNEPNYQMWPQQRPSPTGEPYDDAPVVIDDVVARMFETAQAIQSRIGRLAPLLAGPGTADTLGGGRLTTPYDRFTELLLARLAERGFRAGPRFAWSHHNYNDVTYDRGPGTTAPDASSEPTRYVNSAGAVRRLLVDRWAGWSSADAAHPQLLLTEGGATLAKIAAVWGISDPAELRQKQAELIKRCWERMAAESGDGAGIAMFTQYLLHSDEHYDSGLCESAEAGGAPRAAYETWKELPSRT